MRTIFLHIGKHKTGTTSIQHYLDRNIDFFNSNSYSVATKNIYQSSMPNKAMTANCTGIAHIALRNSLQTPFRIRGADNPKIYVRKIIDALFVNKQLRKTKEPFIIMSSEAFSFIRTWHERAVLKVMFSGFNLVPIVVLRNPEDWLQSWQKQLQRLINKYNITHFSPNSVFNFNTDSWLVNDQDILKVYGKRSIVIQYEEAIKRHGSIIPAFLQTIGLRLKDCPSWESMWVNKSCDK